MRHVRCVHADERALRKSVHGDRAPRTEIDVVRRADGFLVAADDRTARDRERAVRIHAAAPTSRVAGDFTARHRERAVFVHEQAAAPFSRVAEDCAACHRERAAFVHAHAAAPTSRVAGDCAAGQRERTALVHVHSTAGTSRVAGDCAAGHRERAVRDHVHAAAYVVSAINGIVSDRAARHLERTEPVHEYAAAGEVGCVPGDRAVLEAEHGIAPHVNAVVASCHGTSGEAVGEREDSAGTDTEDLALTVVRERVPVQV